MNLRVTSIFLFLLIIMVVNAAKAWEIDWSHRQKKQEAQTSAPGSAMATVNSTETGQNVSLPSMNSAPNNSGTVVNGTVSNDAYISKGPNNDAAKRKLFEGLVQTNRQPYTGDRQEFVILNTGKGFIPSNVRLHKGLHYVVHIVNVNEDKKNVSFMLDAFDQHYATYYGQIRSFNLDPEKEGVFDFQCPETNSSGKLIVFGPGSMAPARTISSDH